MATLKEFTIFSDFPLELRRKIWLSVPQPDRLIGQLPCSKCWKFQFARGNPRTSTRKPCSPHENHADWSLRCVVNDPDQAVFPPLQACRESRAIWLPHYFTPPRYLSLLHQNSDDSQPNNEEVVQLRFDIPYVSYEFDTFAVFDISVSCFDFEVDPLLGFDRQMIQHIGISENAWVMTEAIVAINPQSLPNLQSLSILVSGPNPHNLEADSLGWQEMHLVDMQDFKCDVLTIPEQLVAEHPIFSRPESRLRHPIYQPEPRLRQLSNYIKIFEAWWWHSMHWVVTETRTASEAPWWDFCEYVFEEENSDVCPLESKWCPAKHGHKEMLEGGSGLDIGIKLLVAKECLGILQHFALFESDPEGNYDGFFRYMSEKTTTLGYGAADIA